MVLFKYFRLLIKLQKKNLKARQTILEMKVIEQIFFMGCTSGNSDAVCGFKS